MGEYYTPPIYASGLDDGVRIQLYDYFLTIIPEITLIWPSPWTPIKLLYFLTRYSPLVDSGLAIPSKQFP